MCTNISSGSGFVCVTAACLAVYVVCLSLSLSLALSLAASHFFRNRAEAFINAPQTHMQNSTDKKNKHPESAYVAG